nr:MAG TPA: hypothetical protein [Caudoviricetes sp.]
MCEASAHSPGKGGEALIDQNSHNVRLLLFLSSLRRFDSARGLEIVNCYVRCRATS